MTKWFHNHEYRHLLRDADYMQQWKGHETCQVVWFEKKYTELKKAFQNAGLEVDGFSIHHTAIIASTFKINIKKLMSAYHEEN